MSKGGISVTERTQGGDTSEYNMNSQFAFESDGKRLPPMCNSEAVPGGHEGVQETDLGQPREFT